MMRVAGFLVCSVLCASAAVAHHGIGTFDTSREIELQGVITRVELINPHSWLYFDVADASGQVASFRCEMRSASVLRRSGWTMEMFPVGSKVTIQAAPDRADPNSCYLNTIIFEDGSRADRYGQFERTSAVASADPRPLRRPTGELNISGDWAPEQLVMTDPRGRGGALVPLSQADEIRAAAAAGGGGGRGAGARGGGRGGRGGGGRGGGRGGGAPDGNRPITRGSGQLTDVGEEAAQAFVNFSPTDNPRMRCETTSILFDWTFDGPVNRITQYDDRITLEYGQLGLFRTVHMNQSFPDTIVPSRAGYSIGRWEDDVLVVETRGFAPGVLNAPIIHSDRLYVVERFSLDTERMVLTRSYAAEDPVNFTGQYTGSDNIQVADAAFDPEPCDERGFEDYSEVGERRQRLLETAEQATARPWWKFWGD